MSEDDRAPHRRRTDPTQRAGAMLYRAEAAARELAAERDRLRAALLKLEEDRVWATSDGWACLRCEGRGARALAVRHKADCPFGALTAA